MLNYFIYLENEQGQKGYYGLIQTFNPPAFSVLHEPDNAVRYTSEDEAETALDGLVNDFGLDREEARILALADDRIADFSLSDDEFADGISVLEEDGKRFILVRNGGFEASDEVCDEVANLLVPILLRIRKRLLSKPSGS